MRDVGIEQTKETWRANAVYESHVAKAWSQRRREADQGNFRIWDGTYYRVMNTAALENSDLSMRLRLGTISYRYIATLRLLQEHYESHALEPLYHLSTAALISTNDNWSVFGKRARSGSIDLIGGGVQSDELEVARGTDLERNLTKELREEMGIEQTDILEILGLGILLSSTSNVLVLSHIGLNISRRAVEKAFENREEDEMAEPVFVLRDQLEPFLRSLTDYRTLIPELL